MTWAPWEEKRACLLSTEHFKAFYVSALSSSSQQSWVVSTIIVIVPILIGEQTEAQNG